MILGRDCLPAIGRPVPRCVTAQPPALSAAACGLMLTACGSQSAPGTAASATTTASATATPGTSTAASIEACAISQLQVSLSNTGALAGQAGGYLKFTNHSRTPCRMTGWPA